MELHTPTRNTLMGCAGAAKGGLAPGRQDCPFGQRARLIEGAHSPSSQTQTASAAAQPEAPLFRWIKRVTSRTVARCAEVSNPVSHRGWRRYNIKFGENREFELWQPLRDLSRLALQLGEQDW